MLRLFEFRGAIITKYQVVYFNCLLLVATALTSVLFMQYYQVRKQAEKVLALKQEYKGYINAVKKAVESYQKAKDDEQEVAASKKKITADQNGAFVKVNRASDHLQRSSLSFMKEHVHDASLRRVTTDALLGYHQQLERKTQTAHAGNRKRTTQRKQRATSVRETASSQGDRKINDIAFVWPIERSKFWLSSFFGPRKNPNGTWGFHHGIDMAAIKGTPIHAASSGTISKAGHVKGFGLTVEITHSLKYTTRYAHLSEIAVRHGQRVKQGELIGRVGDTGFVRSVHGKDPSHLHFEVLVFGKRRNPMYFFM